jgi:hypothetical protein
MSEEKADERWKEWRCLYLQHRARGVKKSTAIEEICNLMPDYGFFNNEGQIISLRSCWRQLPPPY